ncbi:PBP1A family penicillin-binding protein [soil metagenome]
MTRTRLRKGANGPKWSDAGRTVHRLSNSRKKISAKSRLAYKILLVLGIVLACIIVGTAGFSLGAYFGLMYSVGEPKEAPVKETTPTYIYSQPLGDTDGSRRVIGTIFHGENRKTASGDEMPPSLLNALVAKEDERFREHAGVDLPGILRALYVDIRAGGAVEGASTITQQYVRHAYLTQDLTVARKLKEAAIAIKVERTLSKEEILTKYLNTVYYGSNAYGVQAAAETYFDKSVENLTVAESATIVGLLWSPSQLGGDRNAAEVQRNLVLQKMFNNGYISDEEYTRALDTTLPEKWPLAPMLDRGLDGSQVSKEFAALVQDELVNELGSKAVFEGGLEVSTTLDLDAQVAAQEVLYGEAGYLAYPANPDAALVSIEPGSGKILAMVGDRDEGSQFDLVTQAKRQPGSSFKTFALIAALEQGIDPTTTYFSGPKSYQVEHENGRFETWDVENFDNTNRGQISLEEALWQSDNSVFTDLAMNADGRGLTDGPAAVVDVAKRLGVSANFGDQLHPSLVLGTQEVSPLDMAHAYATIANQGRKVELSTVSKVVDTTGQADANVIYTAPDRDGEQVIAPEIAAKATEILVGDVKKGIAHKADLEDRTVAGKTGTSERFFDSWFVGYTPQITTAVWMGYAEGGATMEGLLNLGGKYVGPIEPPAVIWRDYTRSVLEGTLVEQFEGVDTARYDPPPPPQRPRNVRGAAQGADTAVTPQAGAASGTASPNVAGPDGAAARAAQTR